MWYLLCCPSQRIAPFIFNHHVQAHPFIVLSTSESIIFARLGTFGRWRQLTASSTNTHTNRIVFGIYSFPNWTQCLGKVQGRFDCCAGCPRSEPCCHTGYSTFSKVPIRASTSCFWKKITFFIKLRWRQIVSRQSRYSFLQEGVENLRIGAPPRL